MTPNSIIFKNKPNSRLGGDLRTDNNNQVNTPRYSTKNLFGKVGYTLVSIAFAAGSAFLVRQKILDDTFAVPWVAIIVICFVSLVLLAISVITWWGDYFEGISETREAELVSVTRDSVARTEKDEPIFYWKFTCKWRENGLWLEASSPLFTGQAQFYNRGKILVRVHPRKPEQMHFVDISFLSTEDLGGIPIVTTKELNAALAHFEELMEKSRNSPLQVLLKSQSFAPLRVKATRLYFLAVFVGTIVLVLLLWWRLSRP